MPMRVLRPASRWCPGLLCFACAAEDPRVAITFDDGPHEDCTPRVLDTLREAGMRATFFFLGCNVRRHPGLVRRAVDEGHEVAAHGMQHVSALAQGAADVLRNADDCHALLEETVGRTLPRQYRPPYGDMTLGGLRALRRRGYRLAYWSYDSDDSFLPDAAAILQRVRAQPPVPGSILLFHDDYRRTAEALPGVIQALRGLELSAATVSELCPR